MGRYDQMIADSEERYNLPPGLLTHMVDQESGGNPNIVSKKGAVGLMQIMPGTQADLGITDPTDPAQSIDGGARYFKQQLDRFGNVPDALAAYNMGPNGFAAGRPLPAETVGYQNNILSKWRGGGPAPSIDAVMQDPEFQGLPEAAQINVLSRIDPEFAKLPGQAQSKVVQRLSTQSLPAQGIDPTKPMPLPKQTDPKTTEDSDNYFKLFVRGVLRGPADSAEGVTVLAQKFVSMFGYLDQIDPRNLGNLVTGEHPEKASWANDLVNGVERKTGVKLPEPKSAGGREVQRIGEEIGATAATLGTATVALAALPEITATAGVLGFLRVVQMMSTPKLVALETILATGGGAVAGVFRELMPQTPDLGDFIGEFIGSGGTAMGLGILRWVKNNRSAAVRAANAEQANKIGVGQELLSAADGDVAAVEAGAQHLEGLRQDIPGFQGTTAGEAKHVPGIKSLQKGFTQSGGGRTVAEKSEYGAAAVQGRFTKRNEEDLFAINEKVNDLRPQGDPTKVGEELDRQQKAAGRAREAEGQASIAKVEAQKTAQQAKVTAQTNLVVQNTEQQMTHAETRATAHAEALRPAVDLTDQQRGNLLRREYLEELNDASKRVTDRYARVDWSVKVPPTKTAQALADMRADLHVAEDPAKVPSSIMKQMDTLLTPKKSPILLVDKYGRPLPTTEVHEIPLGELDALKKRIQQELRDTPATNGALTRRLETLQAGVMDDIEALADDPILRARYPDAATKYADARALARQEIMRLKSGTVDRLRYKDWTGRFKLNDEDLPDKFLRGETPVEDFVKALGSRPGAMAVLKEHLQDNFLRATMDENYRIDPRKAQRWLDDHKNQAALQQFPDLAPDFADAASQNRLAKQARDEYEALDKNRERQARLTNPDLYDRLDQLDQRAARVKALVERTRQERRVDEASAWLGLDADKAARKIITNPLTRNESVHAYLEKVRGNPEALAGFQASLWDASLSKFMSQAATDAANNPALMAHKMRMFLRENSDWMEAAFGPDKMKDLAKVEQALNNVADAKYTGSATVHLFQSAKDIGAAGPLLARMLLDPTGIGGALAFGKLAYRNVHRYFNEMNNEQIAGLFQEAFFDPKVATTLMLMAKNANEGLIRKRLHAHLYNMNQLAPGQYEDQDTPRASKPPDPEQPISPAPTDKPGQVSRADRNSIVVAAEAAGIPTGMDLVNKAGEALTDPRNAWMGTGAVAGFIPKGMKLGKTAMEFAEERGGRMLRQQADGLYDTPHVPKMLERERASAEVQTANLTGTEAKAYVSDLIKKGASEEQLHDALAALGKSMGWSREEVRQYVLAQKAKKK